MPKGPKGEKRPADVIANAVRVARIATGEITDDRSIDIAKSDAGHKGGKARAQALPAKERTEIAKKGSAARWGKKT